jgi:hypothetical protein
MELEKIIKLIDAGYTKADIEKMLTPAAEETKPEAKPADKPEEKPAEKPEEKKPDSEPVNAQMLKELQDLKKAVYAMNIMNTEQPEQKSVDDILAASLKEG